MGAVIFFKWSLPSCRSFYAAYLENNKKEIITVFEVDLNDVESVVIRLQCFFFCTFFYFREDDNLYFH